MLFNIEQSELFHREFSSVKKEYYMPAKDTYHDAVITGLEKDGWKITNDPYTIKIEGITYDIDLGAEKILAAEKEGNKIAVEIKTFIGPSFVNKFHEAMGHSSLTMLSVSKNKNLKEYYI